VLATVDVPERDRLSYWAGAVCDANVQLDCRAPQHHRQVDGEIRVDTLATSELSRVTATAQQVGRTPSAWYPLRRMPHPGSPEEVTTQRRQPFGRLVFASKSSTIGERRL